MGRPTGIADDHQTRRTTVEINLADYEQAKEALGTSTVVETVNTALHEVGRQAKLKKAAAIIAAQAYDIITPEELAEIRSPRVDA